MPETLASKRLSPSGLLFAVAANLIWGALPIALFVLRDSGAVEIVAWRIALAAVFCAILITITRGWGRFAAIVKNRSTFLTLVIASLVLLVNWGIYVFAAISGNVVEASLGYFTTPIVTVLLGVIVLRERLRPLQWVAIAVSVIAVVYLAIAHGSFPWIALSLAVSFGLYGFVKKRVGTTVDALSGMAVETGVLTPVAAIVLIVMAATSSLSIGRTGTLETVLLLSLGIITAVPLLMFATAARRLPLTYIGLTQYLTPIIQLLVGVFLLHEAMPAERWIGFAIVWVALIILTVDLLVFGRRETKTVDEIAARGAHLHP